MLQGPSKIATRALAGIGLAITPLLTLAADNLLDQKVWFRLGAFRPDVTSSARVDHPQTQAPGTTIDFENDLSLKKHKTVPTLLIGARLADRWRLEFEYFQLKRDSVVTLGQVLNFDDSTFPISASLATQFDSSVYRASVGYSLLRTPESEFGAVIGAHVTRFDIALEGDIVAGGTASSVRREEQNRSVPLPTVGLYGTYALSPSWAVTARGDVFKLKVRQYDGRLYNLQANLLYQFNSSLGLGLGYRYDDYKITADRDDFRGEVHYKFHGPQVFLQAGF